MALVSPRASNRTTAPQTVPAPLMGWNTRDPLEAMDPLDAITLDNWYVGINGVLTRNGSTSFATALGTVPVQTLATFISGAHNTLLAACGGRIIDLTGTGGSLVSGGLLSDRWQTATFNRHQIWVNGSDAARIYDGTSMTTTGYTGANMSKMIGVTAYGNRAYFWTGQEQGFWYGTILGIAGALAFFDLSMASIGGGNLIAIDILSIDGGLGPQNYVCFFMSSGEMIMYSGTDPNSSTNWALVGRYTLPPSLGSRGITRYGGDLYIATSNDHLQLSQFLAALKEGASPPRSKISGAATDAYAAGSTLPGWQALYYPTRSWLIFNIPNADGTFSQHINNTSTSAWSRFKDWNAYCFATYNGGLYYGAANGVVMRADIGASDSGTAIVARGQQAWNTFGTPLKKRVAATRAVVESPGTASFALALGYDYQPNTVTVADATVATGDSLVWGETTWGAPHVWGGSGVTSPNWHIAGGAGGAVGISLSVSTTVGATWIRTDLLLEPGSAL